MTKIFIVNKRKTILIAVSMVLIGVIFWNYYLKDIKLTVPSNNKPPPPAILQIKDAEQISAIGTYCWGAKCVDMIGIPTPKEAIVSKSPLVAKLTLPINVPPDTLEINVNHASTIKELNADALGYRWWEVSQSKNDSLPLEKEQTISLNLERGLNVIYVFAGWTERGDATYGFLVEVK